MLYFCVYVLRPQQEVFRIVCLPSVILARVFHQKHGVISTKDAYRVTVFPEYCKYCQRGEGEREMLLNLCHPRQGEAQRRRRTTTVRRINNFIAQRTHAF